LDRKRPHGARWFVCALLALVFHAALASGATGSIQIALDPEGTGATAAAVPAGTASLTWAYMPSVASSGSEVHYTWPRLSPGATFTPPPNDPVVAAVAVNAEGQEISSWSSRVPTSPVGAGAGETPPPSIQIGLTADKTGAQLLAEPTGTAYVRWAYMPSLASSSDEAHYVTTGLTSFTPPAADPVVAALALDSSHTPIGGWAGRIRTYPPGAVAGETPPPSIQIGLTADRTGAQPLTEPAGTAYVHWAYMPSMTSSASEVRYSTTGVTAFTPPGGDPVVDARALDASGTALGGWAGRLQTAPASEPEQPTRAKMTVALDIGGWSWESAVKDAAGAAKHFRSSYVNFDTDSQVELLARNGVQLMPLFNGSPTAGGSELASKVVSWFARYGHGGTFWQGKPVDRGATTAEIVNEPGNPFFWGSGATADEAAYARTIETVAAKVATLAHPPRLLVSFDGGYEGDRYGRALIAADPHLLQLGLGWTVHPYGGHGTTSALGNRARVTEARAATHQPIYVTEVGWPTDTGAGPTGDSLQWTEAQQASNIASFVLWAGSLGYVADVTYFNYADYSPNNWYGIVDASGTTHKLAYDTLKTLTATYGP
jgi:hypothetical protein